MADHGTVLLTAPPQLLITAAGIGPGASYGVVLLGASGAVPPTPPGPTIPTTGQIWPRGNS